MDSAVYKSLVIKINITVSCGNLRYFQNTLSLPREYEEGTEFASQTLKKSFVITGKVHNNNSGIKGYVSKETVALRRWESITG